MRRHVGSQIEAVVWFELYRRIRSPGYVVILCGTLAVLAVPPLLVRSASATQSHTYFLGMTAGSSPVEMSWFWVVDVSGTILAGLILLLSWDTSVRDRGTAAGKLLRVIPVRSTTVFIGKSLVLAMGLTVAVTLGTLISGLLVSGLSSSVQIRTHLIASLSTLLYSLTIAALGMVISVIATSQTEGMILVLGTYLFLLVGWILVPPSVLLLFHPSFAYSAVLSSASRSFEMTLPLSGGPAVAAAVLALLAVTLWTLAYVLVRTEVISYD